MPHPNNAVERLLKALERLAALADELRADEHARPYAERLDAIEKEIVDALIDLESLPPPQP